MTKATFDGASNKITLVEPALKSVMIYKEEVWSILEVSEGNLVIHICRLDLLITSDFAVTQRVVDPDSGNIQKFQLVPFPG